MLSETNTPAQQAIQKNDQALFFELSDRPLIPAKPNSSAASVYSVSRRRVGYTLVKCRF